MSDQARSPHPPFKASVVGLGVGDVSLKLLYACEVLTSLRIGAGRVQGLGVRSRLLGLGVVLSVVVRGQFAGWVQLSVVRVGDHVLLELEVRGSVGLGALVVSKGVVGKRWSAGPGVRRLGYWLRFVSVHVVF